MITLHNTSSKVTSVLPFVRNAFAKEWLQAPLRVGAVAPSGAQLARAMTDGVTSVTGPIIELGPGTGAMTQMLLERGVAPENIAAIELGPQFVRDLRAKHPDVHIMEGNATQIKQLSPFPVGRLKLVVCSLPLLSMPRTTVCKILRASFDLMHQDGTFRLFTYGHRCPIGKLMATRMSLRSRRTATALLNLPPASVYELKRR